MITRTAYLTAAIDSFGVMTTGTLRLEHLPVWSIVTQTVQFGPGGSTVSNHTFASGLLLDEAHHILAELLGAVRRLETEPYELTRYGVT